MSDTQKTGLIEYVSVIGSVLIPVVLIYLGHIYKEAEATDGIHEKYVEMAIGILKEPSNTQSTELRKWAIKVLDAYSVVPIHDEAQKHLLQATLPEPSARH